MHVLYEIMQGNQCQTRQNRRRRRDTSEITEEMTEISERESFPFVVVVLRRGRSSRGNPI